MYITQALSQVQCTGFRLLFQPRAIPEETVVTFTVDPSSIAGQIMQSFAGLQFAGVGVALLLFGIIILVIAGLIWLSSWGKTPPCPKCGSTDTLDTGHSGGAIPGRFYRCIMCTHLWTVRANSEETDLAERYAKRYSSDAWPL